jgi:uncharacterized membrane protein YfcA
VSSLPAMRQAIDPGRLAPMLIAGLVGVPIGIWVLPSVSLGAFKLWFGATVILVVLLLSGFGLVWSSV